MERGECHEKDPKVERGECHEKVPDGERKVRHCHGSSAYLCMRPCARQCSGKSESAE